MRGADAVGLESAIIQRLGGTAEGDSSKTSPSSFSIPGQVM